MHVITSKYPRRTDPGADNVKEGGSLREGTSGGADILAGIFGSKPCLESFLDRVAIPRYGRIR